MNKKSYNYRRIGAYVLMLLSAFSMIAQYALQGVLASGHSTADLPSQFWTVDWVLWAARALIEAVVILYLFETAAEHDRDRRLLYIFEASLIMLITATIAPALRAQGLHQTMPESVSPIVFTLWCIGLAAYTPLMIGGIATALRVQPGGVENVSADVHAKTQEKLDIARKQITTLNKDIAESAATHDRTVNDNRELAAFKAAVTDPEAQKNATSMARMIMTHICVNGNLVDTPVMKHLLGVSGAHISGIARDVKAEQE